MFAASEESIAVLTEDGKGVDFYEPDKYQKQGTLSLNQDLSGVKLVPGESTVWYLASPNGIQRITEDGDMVATIMAGANGLMSTPTTCLLYTSAFINYATEQRLGVMEQKLVNLISDKYKQIYHYYSKGRSEQEKLYLRLLLVTDYISGMTDSFAKNLYQELNGII